MSTEYKEQKVITTHRELKMRTMAREAINWFTSNYPKAREIDIVNVFLHAFIEHGMEQEEE